MQIKGLLLFLYVLLSVTAIAQDEDYYKEETKSDILVIQNKIRNKIKLIHTGKKLTVFYDNLKFYGKLTKVTNKGIYINHVFFEYSRIKKIKVKTVLFTIMGIYLIMYGSAGVAAGFYIAIYMPTNFSVFFMMAYSGGIAYLGTKVMEGRPFTIMKWKFLSNEDYINSQSMFISE